MNMILTGALWRARYVRLARVSLMGVCAWWMASSALADIRPPLTLASAIDRTLQHHPGLAVQQWRSSELQAMRQAAARSPGYELRLEQSDMGLSETPSQLSLTLSSVLELGNQREGRVGVQARFSELADIEQQITLLDLSARVTYRYIDLLEAERLYRLAQDAVVLARGRVDAADARRVRGAGSGAETLRAQASQAQTELETARMFSRLERARYQLTSLWGGDPQEASQPSGDLFELPGSVSFDVLTSQLTDSPATQKLLAEERVRQAETERQRRDARTEVQWDLGVTRVAGSGDYGMTLGVSVPLMGQRRYRPEIRAAEARHAQSQWQSKARHQQMLVQLHDAWQSHRSERARALGLKDRVFPLLVDAERETRRAYDQGGVSFSEWLVVRNELMNARTEAISAAAEALRQQAWLEQLTATSVHTASYSEVSQ